MKKKYDEIVDNMKSGHLREANKNISTTFCLGGGSTKPHCKQQRYSTRIVVNELGRHIFH